VIAVPTTPMPAGLLNAEKAFAATDPRIAQTALAIWERTLGPDHSNVATALNDLAMTKAEWNYAARAGSPIRYFSGDNEKELCRDANLADQTWRRSNEYNSTAGVACGDGYICSLHWWPSSYPTFGSAETWVVEHSDRYQWCPKNSGMSRPAGCWAYLRCPPGRVRLDRNSATPSNRGG
jgi:hypothetical protein